MSQEYRCYLLILTISDTTCGKSIDIPAKKTAYDSMDLLNWSHHEATLEDRHAAFQHVATATECQAVAMSLGILSCHSIEATYQITPLSQGRYRVSGTYHGILDQACTVTLEPVRTELKDAFEIEFWPEIQLQDPVEVELDDPAWQDPEPIVAGRLEVGSLIYELMSCQLDPYPRKEGVCLEITEAPAPSEAPGSTAFAKLAALKFQS